MADRNLGESPAKDMEVQAEADGYSAGKYAGKQKIVDKMKKEHSNNPLTRQAFDRGLKQAQDEKKKK